MIRIEIAQASLPLEYVFFHTIASQWELVKDVFDGIEVHLTNSLATLQIAHMHLGATADYIGGIHAPARGERLSINLDEWPASPYALGYTLAMMHEVRALPTIDRMVHNIGRTNIPVTLYPLVNDEHLRVESGQKLFQLKAETALRYGLEDPGKLRSFILDHPEWSGYVHDIQHSSLFYPSKVIKEIPGIVRGHLSLDRTDLERHDIPVRTNLISKGVKDPFIYEWVMEMARLHSGNMTYVVESPPPFLNPRQWVSRWAAIAGTIRKWTE